MEPKLLAKGVRYQRHRPEQTLLYQIFERYYPELTQFMARQGKRLPNYIHHKRVQSHLFSALVVQ